MTVYQEGLDDTVQDDEGESRDVLTGSSGDDWFFFWSSEDRVTDLKDEEGTWRADPL